MTHANIVALAPSISQYHSQDPFGQYAYGYSGGPSAKQEVRTADGITQGGYSYIDANNIVQSVSYVSDPVNGFRVSATNLPQNPSPVATVAVAANPVVVPAPVTLPNPVVVSAPVAVPAPIAVEAPVAVATPVAVAAPSVPLDTPEVIAARSAHLQAHAAVRSGLFRKRRSIAALPAVYGYAAYSPIVTSQYQTQDALGQYSYGYNDGLSSKAESRAFDGTTNGAYSYVDANGIIQNVQYTADANGFRTAASNLPVGPTPVVAAVAPIAAPIAIAAGGPLETPEVIAAKAAHFAAHVEAKSRLFHA